MDMKHTRTMLVDISMCDAGGHMGIWNSFAAFQDVASEHAEMMGVGGQAMLKRQAFWITVRTRVHFYARPAMAQAVAVSTWPAKPGATRCDRYYRMAAGERLLMEGKTEWCVLDTEKKCVRGMDTLGLDPALPYLTETVCPEPYARFPHDFSEDERVFDYTVLSTDIDVGGHMNNVAYLRALCASFSTQELAAMRIREAEIIFMSSCFEGEALTLMRRATPEGFLFGVRKANGQYAALAEVKAEKRS